MHSPSYLAWFELRTGGVWIFFNERWRSNYILINEKPTIFYSSIAWRSVNLWRNSVTAQGVIPLPWLKCKIMKRLNIFQTLFCIVLNKPPELYKKQVVSNFKTAKLHRVLLIYARTKICLSAVVIPLPILSPALKGVNKWHFRNFFLSINSVGSWLPSYV